MLGVCPRLDGSTADALEVARSFDPFRGMLKKGASLRQGYDRQAGSVPCLRRSGFAQAGPPFVVLTYYEFAPRVKVPAALLREPF